MPTYDYVCDACDHQFELFQSITEPVKKKCPQCGKRKLRRLLGTGAAIMFKGSGFYQTDYRSESYKKKAEADKKAASDTSNGKASDSKSSSAGEKSSSAGEASSSGDKASGSKSDSSKTRKKKE